MKGLLYKDFFLLKNSMIFMAVFQAVITGICVLLAVAGLNRQLTAMSLAACYYLSFFVLTILNQELFLHDEKRSWHSFVGSTPQSSKGQIISKYCMILLTNSILLLWCFLIDAVVVAVADDVNISMVKVGILIFCIRIFFQAIEIPFIIRLGTSVGGSVKGVLLTLVVFFVICYGLFGDISFLLEGNPIAAFLAFINSGKLIWMIAAIFSLTLAAYYLSYRISVRIYQGADYCE